MDREKTESEDKENEERTVQKENTPSPPTVKSNSLTLKPAYLKE